MHTRSESIPPELTLELGLQVGAGGFGDVYHGRMTSPSGLTQEVAIKVLLSGLDPRSQAVARLRDEARVLTALHHPSILRAHELVILDNRTALVTEYVPGADLATVIQWGDKRPGTRAVLEVVGHIADALHAATVAPTPHGPLGLTHRDVKPANIRVTPHGSVRLLDFGIAKARDEHRESHTAEHVRIGSPQYMAPEVITFMVEDGEAPSDIFALGCVLYEALTTEPFIEDMPRRRHKLLFGNRKRYAGYLQGREQKLAVPAQVSRLLRELLAWDRDERPTARQVADSCFELMDDLSGWRLRTWARKVSWPDDVVGEPGEWTGRRMLAPVSGLGPPGASPAPAEVQEVPTLAETRAPPTVPFPIPVDETSPATRWGGPDTAASWSSPQPPTSAEPETRWVSAVAPPPPPRIKVVQGGRVVAPSVRTAKQPTTEPQATPPPPDRAGLAALMGAILLVALSGMFLYLALMEPGGP